MKKSIEISAHIFFWIVFTLSVITLCEIYLKVKPDAPFSQHFPYVVFLELIMGLIFFYTTFFTVPWVRKQKKNLIILIAILVLLLLLFAYPAFHFGIWQVMSSLMPHIMLIFLALVFRGFREPIKAVR